MEFEGAYIDVEESTSMRAKGAARDPSNRLSNPFFQDLDGSSSADGPAEEIPNDDGELGSIDFSGADSIYDPATVAGLSSMYEDSDEEEEEEESNPIIQEALGSVEAEFDSIYDPRTMAGLGDMMNSDDDDADVEAEEDLPDPIEELRKKQAALALRQREEQEKLLEKQRQEAEELERQLLRQAEEAKRKKEDLQKRQMLAMQQRQQEEQRMQQQIAAQKKQADLAALKEKEMMEKKLQQQQAARQSQINQEEDLIKQKLAQQQAALRQKEERARAQAASVSHLPWHERMEVQQQLKSQLWYHGPVDRFEAEQRLKSSQTGVYLVRTNIPKHGFVISASSGVGKVIHLFIKVEDDGSLLMDGRRYKSIQAVIETYTLNDYHSKVRLTTPLPDKSAAPKLPPPNATSTLPRGMRLSGDFRPPAAEEPPAVPSRTTAREWRKSGSFDEPVPPVPNRRSGSFANDPDAPPPPPRNSRAMTLPGRRRSSEPVAPAPLPAFDDSQDYEAIDDDQDYEVVDDLGSSSKPSYEEKRRSLLGGASIKSKPLPSNPATWTNSELLRYLKEQNMKDFVEVTYSNGFSGQQFIGLDAEAFRKGGFPEPRIKALRECITGMRKAAYKPR